MKKSLPLLFLALVLPRVYAQTEPAQSCRAIVEDAARLACFDRLYAPAAVAEHKATEVQPPAKAAIDLEQSYQASMESGSPQMVLAQPDEADSRTVLSRMYDLGENQESGIFTVREHEPMYLIPAYYRSSPNYTPYSSTRGYSYSNVLGEQKRLEAKMQVSFKTKLVEDLFSSRADVWFGYTQQSNWQVYNQGDESAPFRNNDYAPEFFLTQPVKANLPGGGKLRMLGVGYIHQSNGQSRPQSRSWNRIYATAGMEWGKLTVMPRIWARIDPNSSKDDDNPDITDYMGFGDVKMLYQYNDKHHFMATLRYNPFKHKGAVQLGYTFPLRNKLKLYVQGFHGYGENLIDYNHKQTGIGIGVMLNDWNSL